MHPAHRPVQLGQPGDDLGLSGGQDGQGQHVGDGRRATGRGLRVVLVHGDSLLARSL
ncbi:hypothetical protein PV963_02695 [Streptomyces coeruleorubidus]|nr:hypothetical protein [Streptomyces coeruleorubidus]WDV57071.1 hypothetical protein PV963_02695 [Streptomyces coeruleorubidus]